MNIELKTNNINTLLENLEDMCIDCNAYRNLCNICPVNNSIAIVSKFKAIKIEETKIDGSNVSFHNLIFNKNKVLLVQNSLEEICSDCNLIGIYCKKCYIHQIKRDITSLPVKDSNIEYNYTNKKIKKSCGTSCKTSCNIK
jgi:hypothetical protein